MPFLPTLLPYYSLRSSPSRHCVLLLSQGYTHLQSAVKCRSDVHDLVGRVLRICGRCGGDGGGGGGVRLFAEWWQYDVAGAHSSCCRITHVVMYS